MVFCTYLWYNICLPNCAEDNESCVISSHARNRGEAGTRTECTCESRHSGDSPMLDLNFNCLPSSSSHVPPLCLSFSICCYLYLSACLPVCLHLFLFVSQDVYPSCSTRLDSLRIFLSHYSLYKAFPSVLVEEGQVITHQCHLKKVRELLSQRLGRLGVTMWLDQWCKMNLDRKRKSITGSLRLIFGVLLCQTYALMY